jgi:3-oxoacyl-[acyl-carrier-protein] synthase-1
MGDPASPPAVVITGLGMVTSIGYRAAVATTSARAGLQRFVELEGAFDRTGEAVVGAPVALLGKHPTPLIEMMTLAAAEAFGAAYPAADQPPRSLWVSVSVGAPVGAAGPPLGRYPIERLQAALGHVPLDPSSEVRTGCHTAVFEALAEGLRRLRGGDAAACVIGGVDSLIRGGRLSPLDARNRLKTADCPHGLVPGEAAAFLVLEREPDARRRPAPAWARLGDVGLGHEANPLGSEQPCLGQGLSEAIRQATRAHGEQPRPLLGILCDLNGEPYRANEWGLARSRALRWAREVKVWHPADCWGDVGAATGAVLLAFGAAALRQGFAPSPELLVWAGAEGGQRAAVVLTPASDGK